MLMFRDHDYILITLKHLQQISLRLTICDKITVIHNIIMLAHIKYLLYSGIHYLIQVYIMQPMMCNSKFMRFSFICYQCPYSYRRPTQTPKKHLARGYITWPWHEHYYHEYYYHYYQRSSDHKHIVWHCHSMSSYQYCYCIYLYWPMIP